MAAAGSQLAEPEVAAVPAEVQAPAWRAAPIYLALGLVVGLGECRRLVQFLADRAEELERFPRPVGALWLQPVRPAAEWLERWERPLIGLTVALLLVACGFFAAALNPRFRLLRSPGRESEGAARGFGAHVDVPLLLRAGLAAVLTAWWLGALAPLALLLPPPLGFRLALPFGGIPLWTVLLPGVAAPLAHGFLLGALLGWLWGPSGPVFGAPDGGGWRRVLLMGLAATPAGVLLHGARFWLPEAAPAFGVVERVAWLGMLAAALAAPTLAVLWLGFLARQFRPDAPGRAGERGSARGALACLAIAAALAFGGVTWMQSLQVGQPNLSRALGLRASPLQRFAVVLSPGGPGYSITLDGTIGGPRDQIACDGTTVTAVERFLARTRYRSRLAFRAFVHLHDCASLDWLSTRALEVDLEMLERTGSAVAAQLLLERLSECPVSPENRRILDRLADPARFVWPQPLGRRWLGAAYIRFGDVQRARQYLLQGDLDYQELRQMLGGVTPLAQGTIRGQLRIAGRAVRGVRLGLVRADRWRGMLGAVRPFQWRHVLGAAHTDAAGRFEFRNIPEGRYVLVVTGGGIGRYGGRPRVTPYPGVVELDRFRAVRELPPFDLRFEGRPRFPGTGAPRTAV